MSQIKDGLSVFSPTSPPPRKLDIPILSSPRYVTVFAIWQKISHALCAGKGKGDGVEGLFFEELFFSRSDYYPTNKSGTQNGNSVGNYVFIHVQH